MVVAVFALAVNFSMANSPYIHQENVSMIAFQREVVITIPAANPRNAANTIKWIQKNLYLSKEHQSIVIISILVNLFTYAKNPILLSILTVSRAIIHRNKIWRCLLDQSVWYVNSTNVLMTETDILLLYRWQHWLQIHCSHLALTLFRACKT